MSDTYDEIIRQVLAAKGKLLTPFPESDTDEMLIDYPKSTAKVPQDRMRDTPWEQYIPPITGDQTTPRVVSREAAQDVETRKKMEDITRQQVEISSKPGFVVQDILPLAKAYSDLAATSPYMLQGKRMNEQRAAVPGDADAMIAAIERRQKLGRGE